MTWATAPGPTGVAAAAPSGAGWVEWDVTAHDEALLAGANTGFLVRDAGEGALAAATQTFSSREGDDPPQLVVSFGRTPRSRLRGCPPAGHGR